MKKVKISNTEFNKFVAYVDKHFTYDSRYKKKEDPNEPFDYCAFDHERKLSIFIRKSVFGVFVSINKNGTSIIRKSLRTYAELNEVRHWISLIG